MNHLDPNDILGLSTSGGDQDKQSWCWRPSSDLSVRGLLWSSLLAARPHCVCSQTTLPSKVMWKGPNPRSSGPLQGLPEPKRLRSKVLLICSKLLMQTQPQPDEKVHIFLCSVHLLHSPESSSDNPEWSVTLSFVTADNQRLLLTPRCSIPGRNRWGRTLTGTLLLSSIIDQRCVGRSQENGKLWHLVTFTREGSFCWSWTYSTSLRIQLVFLESHKLDPQRPFTDTSGS